MIALRKPPASPPASATSECLRNRNGFDKLPWDNLRLFLAVAEAGSFRSAATLACVSINTIRSKVERLERQIGGPLLRRSVEGVALTQDGRELLQIAREMRELGRSTARVARGALSESTKIRIVASEEVGSGWLVPKLAAAQDVDPDIRLSLHCEFQTPQVLFRDVDLAVQIEQPTDPDLIVERVATLHIMPFASQGYIERHGLPRSTADASGHRLVWLRSDPIMCDMMETLLEDSERPELVTFETNTSSAHYAAIAGGGGIGFLPTYVKLVDPTLQAVEVGIRTKRDVFLVRHARSLGNAQIDTACAWVAKAFDAARFPCFVEAFVDPQTFDR